jgi:hypothetical protein
VGLLVPTPEVPKLWGAVGLGGIVCTRDVCILNEMWAQDKIYILVGILLG